ncbi:MAG: alpha-1,4-glucan--maltose-1-phosphate maltosyltransferase [Nitrospirota bacterium]|nr:alpha-1,4-glucan--maltose-1-phosphate maltosyltransferase [Nitrospirota bacterium]
MRAAEGDGRPLSVHEEVPTAKKGTACVIEEGRRRVVIENVKPEIEGGTFPAKRVVGEKVEVTADIFSDGHDSLSARMLYRRAADPSWTAVAMLPRVNDRWCAEFTVAEMGSYVYTVEGWVDHFRTWQRDLKKKHEAGQDLRVDLMTGLKLVARTVDRAVDEKGRQSISLLKVQFEKAIGRSDAEAVALALGQELTVLMERYPDRNYAVMYGRELEVIVDPPKALFSTWYEFFPRSVRPERGTHGTFRDCEKFLPYVASMGFDVIYLPPIHPIGTTKRKGKNNATEASLDDIGSPWAIGSAEGGHDAVHPELGTPEDLERFVKKARDLGIDVALDLALQCSPDHPYVKDHPNWFRHRPDGTVQFAENPPKKYEDIYPLNFESEDWQGLWQDIRRVVLFWIAKGVRIFRVDNPHTKPFVFWQWLITDIRKVHPEVFFLAEAFTRPKIMYRLGKVGFAQSYTYFTWRYTKREFLEYLIELTRSDLRDLYRPNFWPNTPDILPEHLQYGGRPAFIMRYLLAATLSSNVGIYGPAFELCVNEPVSGKEEYLHSEKYEIKHWDLDDPKSLKDVITRINRIRRENKALQTTWNLEFYETDNDNLFCYGKSSEDGENSLIIAVNLDPFHTQSGWVTIPVKELGLGEHQPFLVHDLIGDDKYIWEGARNFLEINPAVMPGNIFRVRKKLKRETDFDYFL